MPKYKYPALVAVIFYVLAVNHADFYIEVDKEDNGHHTCFHAESEVRDDNKSSEFHGVLPSPYPVKVIQEDGSAISILGKGNMMLSYTETEDGFTVVKNQNGIYEYAVQEADGSLSSSGIKAQDEQYRNSTEVQFLTGQPKHVRLSPAKAIQVTSGLDSNSFENPAQAVQTSFPTNGSPRVLMLLIKYPDLPNTYTVSNFHNFMNQPNYNGTGSFKDYYQAASFGSFSPATDVYGWYTASKNYAYYGRSNGYNVARELLREAVDAAQNAGVDFSLYDNDNDGYVDGVIAVHAGPGAEEGSRTQYIWSHRSGLGSYAVNYDGVWINDYMFNPETRSWGMVGIGVFCHEFGHGLGLPDLYDIDGGSEGVGRWCVMGSGGWMNQEKTPVMFSAWCKEQLGWVSPTVLQNSGNYTLSWAVAHSQAYRVNTPVNNEYFLLENRQKTGFDAFLPGEGLAIWHINHAVSSNANENLKLVDLEEADGLNNLDNEVNRGDAGDLYPGSSVNRQFNNTSNPNSKNYNGNNSHVVITGITEQSGIVDNVQFQYFNANSPCPNGCNDNNPCTTDSCVNNQCVFTPINCDDGNPCTIDDCNNGQCTNILVCGGPWTITPTDKQHTILFNPSLITSDIAGAPLASGDYIAVFFDVSGVLKAGGIALWNGNSTEMIAFGDNALTGLKDGFSHGENFEFKVWRASNQTIYDVAAAYVPANSLPGISQEGAFTSNGVSSVTSLTSCVVHNIPINAGWNIISSNVIPDNPEMNNVINDIRSSVTILKDDEGKVVFPYWNLNEIGDWNVLKGYVVNATQNTTLNIGCAPVDPTTPIVLQPGISLISYLRTGPMNMATALQTINNNLVIVKNSAGDVYFPQFGLNEIGNMEPGKGYQIKMNSADVLVYPGN